MTITYAEGVETDSNDPTSWDGTSYLYIRKAATITINKDFTTEKDINLVPKDNNDFEIIIKGNGHTITKTGSLSTIYSKNRKTTINNLNINSTGSCINISSDVEVNNSTFISSGDSVFKFAASDKTLTINSGKYTTQGNEKLVIWSKEYNNTINLKGGDFLSIRQIITCSDNTSLNISGGSFSLTDPGNMTPMLYGGQVTITGGTFDGKDKTGPFIWGSTIISINNCTIKNFHDGVDLYSMTTSNTIGTGTKFENNTYDFELAKNQTINFDSEFTNEVKVYINDYADVKYGVKRQITSTTEDTNLINYLKSYAYRWSVGYDSDGKYYYIFKDQEKLVYGVVDNVFIATDNLGSPYNEYLNFYLLAGDKKYDGKEFEDPVRHVENSSYLYDLLKDQYTLTYEGINGTSYDSTSTPPTEVGEYKVTLSLKGQSISDTFKITKKNTYKVSYKFVSEDTSLTLPSEVNDLLPSETTVEEDTIFTPTNPSNTSVEVSNGTWNFKGYDVENKKIDSDYTFTGTWSFTKKEEPKPEESKPSTPTLTKAGTYTSSINIEAKSGDESLTVVLNVTVDGKTTTYKGKGSVTVSLSGSDNESKTYTIESYVLSSDGSIQSDVVKETYIIDKTNNKTDNNTNTNTNTNTSSSQGNVPCEVSGRVWSMKQQKCVYKVSNTSVK